MGKYLDFAAIKAAVSIEQAVAKLGLVVTKSQNQLRGPCPVCQQGGDRALAITPAKGLFYCFASQEGGDQIALVAHIRAMDTKAAAEWLGGTVLDTKDSTVLVSKDHATAPPSPGMAALDYLDPAHAAVTAVGFSEEDAIGLGIGYAPKGILRGTVAIPIRLASGELVGYIGITEAKLPPKFHLPKTNVVKLKTG